LTGKQREKEKVAQGLRQKKGESHVRKEATYWKVLRARGECIDGVSNRREKKEVGGEYLGKREEKLKCENRKSQRRR
jgi:hypothetical protein